MSLSRRRAVGSIRSLMDKVLGDTFSGASWSTWRTLLMAIDSGDDSLSDADRALIQKLTGRTVLPVSLRELWIICGRRSGKSIVAGLIAVWATTCRTYTLTAGEVGTFVVIASDRRQARVLKRYISGLLRSTPLLEDFIAEETADEIRLTNGLVIEIHTASFRSLRGYTVIGAVCDEICFWDSEETSANPDKEILIALRAAMATVPEALLLCISSPWARRGEAWRQYERHFGRDDSDRVLFVNAPTLLLNPTVDPEVIAAAYADDPIAASAEYGGEWRRDVEAWLPADVLDAVRVPGRVELAPQAGVSYVGFVDPSGGTGADSMTLAIAHRERDVAVLDCVREQRPPFSPESCAEEFAKVFHRYGVRVVSADRYAGDWPAEQFRKFGIDVRPSEKSRSELYLAVLPAIASRQVELLDVPRLIAQLNSLERRKGRQGRELVDAPPRKHEDVANAAAGALVLAGAPPRTAVALVPTDKTTVRQGLGAREMLRAAARARAEARAREIAEGFTPAERERCTFVPGM